MPPKETHEIKMMYAVYADGREEPIVIDEIKNLTLEEAEPILEEHDFVKVTRCKDCCHREHCRTTNVWAVSPSADWFCADGERREDAEIH